LRLPISLNSALGVLAELGLLDQGQGTGDGQGDVGYGHADGLLAGVEADDRQRQLGEGGGEVIDVENGHRL
jgi:hypothetical protein